MTLKSRTLVLSSLVLASSVHAANLGAVVTKGDSIGTTYLFDGNASVGGGDHDSANGPPENTNFDRSWGFAPPGAGGVDLSITGIAFGLPAANNTNGNVITVTITYLGADGVAGGGDDVVLGSRDLTFVLGAAARYEGLFDTPITGNINGIGTNFRVRLESLEANNGGSTFNMRFKTTSGTAASAVKMDVAGTSTSIGLVDADADGIHDPFETNTGIYAGPTNTGTNPALADTDGDGLKDGWENNTRTWVSGTRTGTNPVDADSDNDGLLDGVETNTNVFVSASDTGTNPNTRDRDNDRLSDGYEVANGLNPVVNADFDSDGFNDGIEVVIYGSNPKLSTSFPGDGTSPAPGSFTLIEDAGPVAAPAVLDTASSLGATILNEAAAGGSVDADFTTGVTNFVLSFPNLFPAAGSTVSITGFAWPVVAAINTDADILLQVFDPGADGVLDGIDTDTLVGTARGTLQTTGVTTVMYWNFTPINFTSSGTGLVVKLQSTAALRIKAQDNFGSGLWRSNEGYASFGARSSRVSIGGTVTPPASTFAAWRTANFTAGTIDDDHDGDGVANGIEYFLGGASNTTGFTLLPGLSGNSITWTKATGYSGAYNTDFVVETSSSLTGVWSPAPLGTGPGQVEITGNDVKFTFPTGTRLFARLRVTGP